MTDDPMIDCPLCDGVEDIDTACPACEGTEEVRKSRTERGSWPEMREMPVHEWEEPRH